MADYGVKRPGEDDGDSNDLKKARAAPSPVVHLRNLPSECTEAEINAIAVPFGRVVNILMLKGKTQAFIEMEDVATATNLVNCYLAAPPFIRKRPIYVQYSMHQKINNPDQPSQFASMAMGGGMQAVGGGAGTIIHSEIHNMIYPVTLDTLYQVFSKFGSVLRMVTFNKNDKFQCLVQFSDAMTASNARMMLDGQNIYAGCCTLKCNSSKLTHLTVKYNNDKSWDFTNPNLPASDMNAAAAAGAGAGFNQMAGMGGYGGGMGQPQGNMMPAPGGQFVGMAGNQPGLGGHVPGCVLIISGLPLNVSVDQIFTLVGVYADVERVRIMFNKQDTALVQTRDPAQAQLAISNLNGVTFMGSPIRVALSKHSEVSVSRNQQEEAPRVLSKDFFNSPLHRFRVQGSRNYQNITNPNPTLHVSNLPATATDMSVREKFAPYGNIVALRFLPSKNAEATRQMCLVRYVTVEEAINALVNMHNFPFADDLHLRVSFSKSEA